MDVRLSAIDKERFGLEIAKTLVTRSDSISAIVGWCSSHKVEMLIARCDTGELGLIHEMEAQGFQLMDTLVYFQLSAIARADVTLPEGYNIRFGREDDAQAVEHLAAKAFTRFYGHYHADSRLLPGDCDLVYSSWASNSLKMKGVADVVFVVEWAHAVVAFLTVKVTAGEAEIVLNAVDPSHQGKGLYAALVSSALTWCAAQTLARVVVSTQVNNVAPQKVWCRHGFVPSNSFYTLHKWFK